MKFKAIYLLLIPLLLILIVTTALLMARISRGRKLSEELLSGLDKKIINNEKIKDADIYAINLTTNKDHRLSTADKDTNYIASVSKLYSATIIFQLMDEGKISSTDNIDKYLDKQDYQGILMVDGQDHSAYISIQNLLDQNSGLADYELDYKIDGKDMLERLKEEDFSVTFEDAVEITRGLEGRGEPGNVEKSYYSNMNALLLGKIAENVTGQTLEDLYQERIIELLNLKNTYIPKNTGNINPIFLDNKEVHPIKYITSAPAAGGLASSN